MSTRLSIILSAVGIIILGLFTITIVGMMGYGPLKYYRYHPFPSDPGDVLLGKSKVPITVYALESKPGHTHPPQLRDYRILGQIQLTAPQSAAVLAESFQSIETKDRFLVTSIMCIFDALHAIAFEQSGKQYIIILCFEKGELYAYCDDKLISTQNFKHIDESWYFCGNPGKLNALLDATGIKRSKPASEQ